VQPAGPRDPEAGRRLLEQHSRLVWDIVNRFRGRGEELDDLYQVGCVGLLKAARRYDPRYGTRFSTFAVPTVMGEIRRHLRDRGPLRVSRRLKEVAGRASRARTELEAKLGREPTLQEVAAALDVSPDELVQALEASRPPLSLYEPWAPDEGGALVLDRIAVQEAEGVLERVALRQALDRLPPRERQVLKLRFFEDLTQTEIAGRLGVSQGQVSRLERHALRLIREHLEA